MEKTDKELEDEVTDNIFVFEFTEAINDLLEYRGYGVAVKDISLDVFQRIIPLAEKYHHAKLAQIAEKVRNMKGVYSANDVQIKVLALLQANPTGE